MTYSMEKVWKALQLDREGGDFCHRITMIEEQHGTNANFLINAILWYALKKMDAVCLILSHNTFGHYHNVGMKLGYNLQALKEKGQITIVEPMKIIASNIADVCKDNIDKKCIIPDCASVIHRDIVHRLFTYVKEKHDEAARFKESVVFIIDDISHFLDFGLDVLDVINFMRYLRTFIEFRPTSTQLCILTHTSQCNSKILNTDMIANALKHMAHLCIITQPFKTARLSDPCGKLIVHWKTNFCNPECCWSEKSTYMFILSNHIIIDAPGGYWWSTVS